MPHGEPDLRLPPPEMHRWLPPPGVDGVAASVSSVVAHAVAATSPEAVTLTAVGSKPASMVLPAFNVWHFLRDLPEAYQRDVRAKVADTMLYAPWGLQALFVRQGTFTLCALRNLAGSGPANVDPVAYGLAKRNMRVGSQPGKGPESECAQAGQRAALGRAVDAWLRGKLAWTRPRHKEA